MGVTEAIIDFVGRDGFHILGICRIDSDGHIEVDTSSHVGDRWEDLPVISGQIRPPSDLWPDVRAWVVDCASKPVIGRALHGWLKTHIFTASAGSEPVYSIAKWFPQVLIALKFDINQENNKNDSQKED